MVSQNRNVGPGEYRALAEFRYQIRRFLHFSEMSAHQAGLEPVQHQLLLALKGLPAGTSPRITELAGRLHIRHHSAVELSNRLARRGYITRHRSEKDRREVWLGLTRKGERVLQALSLEHKSELQVSGPALVDTLRKVIEQQGITNDTD